MGNYGYICNKCKLSVRGGEKAVLRHIRHGQLAGETRGCYDGYGGVVEDKVFNGFEGDFWGPADGSAVFAPDTLDDWQGANDPGMSAHPNSHRQLWLSQYKLDDSKGFIEGARVFGGKPLDWMGFRAAAPAAGIADLSKKMYATWEALTPYSESHTQPPLSGVEAWHAYCFEKAKPQAKEAHVISESDPDQSWGKPRKKYL